MNNIDPREGVTVDRSMSGSRAVRPGNFGDQVPVGDMSGAAFVYYDGGICPWGNYGCNIDGRWNDLAGNTEYYRSASIDPLGASTDTRIRYDTPEIAGPASPSARVHPGRRRQ